MPAIYVTPRLTSSSNVILCKKGCISVIVVELFGPESDLPRMVMIPRWHKSLPGGRSTSRSATQKVKPSPRISNHGKAAKFRDRMDAARDLSFRV